MRLNSQPKSGKRKSKFYIVRHRFRSFQKQICEQLTILRSKASENQVENTIRAITNHSTILTPTENESYQSEANDFSERLTRSSSKTSSDSLWSQTREVNKKIITSSKTLGDVDVKKTIEEYGNSIILKAGDDASYNSCRSDDTETTGKQINSNKKVKKNFDEPINSKRLQTNLNLIHQDLKTKRPDKMRTSNVLNDYKGSQAVVLSSSIESTLELTPKA